MRVKAEKPIESPAGSEPVTRLIGRLREEGFSTEQRLSELDEIGEIIFRRPERIFFASGQTVFIFTKVAELNERILRQSSEFVVNTYKAKDLAGKALAVLQATTVYHCLVSSNEQPHNEVLHDYITRGGGATFIPAVFVPEINQVLYPDLEEKIGSIRPRVEYLQYLLGERLEPVDMHKQTRQAFYISIAVVIVLLGVVIASMFAY
jgi:hypothetical protein